MSTPVRPDRPGSTGAGEPAVQQPQAAPRRSGPDAFVDARRKPAFALDPARGTAPMRRGRMLDPRLIPVVPPEVTTDPARQFHALLGLPPTNLAKPPPREPGNGPDLESLLASLPPARSKIIRQVLSGEDTRLKRALIAFIEDAKFAKLDFEAQRRAIAAFDLRWP